MTADPTALRRSPLAGRDLPTSGAVTVTEVPFLAMVNLRTASAPALPLPEALRATQWQDRHILWLGPDEWLVVGPDGTAPAILADLAPHASAVSAVDVSANRTTVEVSGPSARDVLEKGIALDLHPRAFTPGSVASTNLARTQLILWQTAPETYRLLVRPSFATYLADWLTDATAEYL